jgi:hypothetical protein
MSDEPTIYTREELDGLTRVQLRQLAVNTYGMDNTKCAKTKAKDLKDWIMEKQEGGGGGNSEGKNASSGKKAGGKKAGGGKSRPSSGGRRGRPSASTSAPKGGGRRTRSRKPAEPEPEPEPQEDEGGEEGAAMADVDLSAIEERLDALGKAVDEHDEEVRPQLVELGETVADIQRNQFIQFGLLCDIREALYEDDDLNDRLDALEAEWEEGQGDQGDDQGEE